MASPYQQKVCELLPKSGVVSLRQSDTVALAISLLKSFRISSAPVLGSQDEFVGVLDILDLLAFLCEVEKTPRSQLPNGQTSTSGNLPLIQFHKNEADMEDIARRSAKFNLASVGEVLGLSGRRHPFVSVQRNSSIATALRIFGQGVRLLPVVDDAGKVEAVCSPHDALAWLARIDGFHPKDMSLKEWGVLKQVATVSETETAIDAFLHLHSTGLTALGVVDKDGRLIGNMSASDVLLLKNEAGWVSLLQPLSEFLHLHHRPAHPGLVQRRPLVSVSVTDSLSKVFQTLTQQRVHQVYITDKQGTALGFVSGYDILRTLDLGNSQQ